LKENKKMSANTLLEICREMIAASDAIMSDSSHAAGLRFYAADQAMRAALAAAPVAAPVAQQEPTDLMHAIYDNRKVAFEFYKFASDSVGPERDAARKALLASDAQLRALLDAPVAAPADADPNAPWLSLAHMICSDAGSPPGHITARLEALRDKIDAPVAAPAEPPATKCSHCEYCQQPSDCPYQQEPAEQGERKPESIGMIDKDGAVVLWANQVPRGAFLYAAPVPVADRNAVLTEAATACELLAKSYDNEHNRNLGAAEDMASIAQDCAEEIRSLRSDYA
jgi:hypothetical protein